MRFDVALCALTAGSAAVFSGALFAFSSFVMPALRSMPAKDGLAAMQAINVAAPRSLLMLPMGLLAAGSVAVIARSVMGGGVDTTDERLRLAGAALGLASVVITVAANVPLNNRLAVLAPDAARSAAAWQSYSQTWTEWNHGRVGAGLVAAALLAWAAARG